MLFWVLATILSFFVALGVLAFFCAVIDHHILDFFRWVDRKQNTKRDIYD